MDIKKFQKGAIALKDIRRSLLVKPVRKSEHLSFNWREFSFFNNSEHGSVLFFGSSRSLAPLAFLPYILSLELIFFRRKRYFVKLKQQAVGLFVLREKHDALYISSLAVAPEFRRFGIATYILSYAEKLARRLGKQRLELSVLKLNTAAQRVYRKFGFMKKEEKKWSYVLSRKI
jgi:ribosomal protein S18 acetylase RimI-like enzyme